MASTHNGNSSPTGETPQRSLFENARQAPVQNQAERGLSADPKMPLQIEPMQSPDGGGSPNPRSVLVAPEHAEPIWAQRLKLVVFVVFCVELGILLIYLPWQPVWTNNSLLTNYPTARAIVDHYFTRGAASGLGLVDVWIGIWAAVQYREKK